MSGTSYESAESSGFVPGWGPYMIVSGWALLIAAPLFWVTGAHHVARVHGDLGWFVFCLICVGAALWGMALLIKHSRTRRQRERRTVSASAVPVRDAIWGLGLLSGLAIATVIACVVRWLQWRA